MRLQILAFAMGVLLLQVQPVLPAGSGWVWLAGGLTLVQWRWPGRAARLLALLGCLAIGFGWAAWRAEARLAESLPVAWEGRDIALQGVVATLPQDFGTGSRFAFVVDAVLTPDAVVPGRLMLSWYQGRTADQASSPLSVKPGERWRFTVRLKRPHGNANPGGFDYEAWLFEHDIRATGYIRPDPAQRVAAMVWQPAYVVERLRHAIRERFAAVLPAASHPLAGVLVALAIGDQKAIDGDLWAIFNRTATTHLMSISGLHVTMVAALFGWLVSAGWRRVPVLALRLPAQKAGIVAAALAAFVYALLAGFAVPAQRTLYMLLVAALAMLAGRLAAPGRILLLALLVVLLIDPWAVLAAGFWLSFAAVGALLYVGSAEVGQGRGWRQAIRAWGMVQWAATLASLPILLLLFQEFSLVSPLANALAIPVVSLLVTPLALLGAILPWWPILALAHGILEWLMIFLAWCATWPLWQASAPPLLSAVAAGFGVALLLLPRGVPGRWLGALFLIPVLFSQAPRPPAGAAWITVLDVGQGLASVVRTHEHTLVYDPGPLYSAESDAGQRVVVPYLRHLGIDHVDLLMVTHRDSDHSGGTASVQSALSVGELRSSVSGIGGQRCLAGQAWEWDGVAFAVLHPDAPAYAANGKANHLSCVLRVNAGGKTMLLTSDIEAPDEAALLARAAGQLAADVLLVPHHGSRTSSTPEFLQAVGAQVGVIPVGYRNRFGHPKPEILERFMTMGIPLWRTDRDGAVEVRLDGEGLALSGWRREYRRYWHDQ